MTVVFRTYPAGAEIPVLERLRDRKLVKYLNRETMAALQAAGELHDLAAIPPEAPFYYATGRLEFEDYGLPAIAAGSRDGAGRFSAPRFVREGIATVSPLNQFKVLQNMALAFVSINLGLKGDNAVVYASARALLWQALAARHTGPLLLGAGKTHRDGRAEAGFALVSRRELEGLPLPAAGDEGVQMLERWSQGVPG